MSFESALFSIITEDETLTELIGDRIFPDSAPQDTARPYLLFMVDDLEDPSPSHDGFSGWLRGPFPILIVADTYQEVTEISPELRRVLNDYEGIVGEADIAWIKFDGQTDIDSQVVPGTADQKRFLREQTYRTLFGESQGED